MPNPLLRLGAPRVQKTEPPDRPHPLAPIPEHTSEPNFPYRGSETHGVPPTTQPEEFTGYEGTHGAEYEIVPPDDHVVPVRIVQSDAARQRRYGRSFQVPVTIDGGPTQIIGRNDARVKCLVRVLTTNPSDVIYFGGSREQASSMHGYAIRQETGPGTNAPYEFLHDAQSSLWVNVPAVVGGSPAGFVLPFSGWEIVTVDL